MSESKLFKSVIIGALAGAALSMFDKKTREHTIQTVKKTKDTVYYYAKNREELQQIIEEKVELAQTLYENASDRVSVLIDKMDEVKEIPSTIQGLVSDTKNTLSKNQLNE